MWNVQKPTLKTHWWPSAVVCSMVRLLSLLTHSPFPVSILYDHSTTAKFFGGSYNAMMSSSSEDIWFLDNYFSLSKWISIIFFKKLQYHKRKDGIYFGDDGPNHLEIRAQNKHFSSFRIITCV